MPCGDSRSGKEKQHGLLQKKRMSDRFFLPDENANYIAKARKPIGRFLLVDIS